MALRGKSSGTKSKLQNFSHYELRDYFIGWDDALSHSEPHENPSVPYQEGYVDRLRALLERRLMFSNVRFLANAEAA